MRTCRAFSGSTRLFSSSSPSGMSQQNQGCSMMPGIVMRCPASFTSMRLQVQEEAWQVQQSEISC